MTLFIHRLVAEAFIPKRSEKYEFVIHLNYNKEDNHVRNLRWSTPLGGLEFGRMHYGFMVALLNPKTTLFFAAFLPPFVKPGASVLVQTLGLGATFVAIAAVTDTAYALGAAWLRPWLSRGPRLQAWGRRASAAVYVLLGVFAALAEHRPATR